MGIFVKEALRLLRESWKDPQTLAEELYAILTSDAPIEITSPVTITNTSNQPGLTINQAGPSDYPIRLERNPEVNPNLVDTNFPGIVVPGDPGPGGGSGPDIFPAGGDGLIFPGGGDDGGLIQGSPYAPGTYIVTLVYPDGSTEVFRGNQGNRQPIKPGAGVSVSGGGGIPGQIVSGSGNTYQVAIYPDGLDEDSEEVEVRQLQIAEDATIPEGTWAIVTQVGDEYFMQVPVWLDA